MTPKMNHAQNLCLVLTALLATLAPMTPAAAQETLGWTLINQTQQTMTLMKQEISGGRVAEVPHKLSNNSHGEIEIVAVGPISMSGTFTYQLDNDDLTKFVLRFNRPYDGAGTESVSIVGGSNRYQTSTRRGPGGNQITTLFETRVLAEPDDCNEYFNVTVQNNSGYKMTQTPAYSASKGKFSTPPSTSIAKSGSNAWWASGTCGLWTGVKGVVDYQLDDANNTTLDISFYKPYDGSGYFKAVLGGSSAGNYNVCISGYDCCDSDHNTVTVTVQTSSCSSD